MDSMTIIAVASIVTAGLTTGFGCLGPALGEGKAVATALTALAQQPDASATITRTLFVAAASLCTIIPGYEPPTGSLSTTVALALCVFVAVPWFGIKEQGIGNYLASYVQPTFIMLPFNIISELSRTLALAVRLFGNMMSGSMIIAILLTITPFLFPIVMTALGLLTGMVQAYIFFILATVYIAAATRTREPKPEPKT